MRARLIALDEGPDIPLDREIVLVGRHPQCNARLDSIRVSRRHCCMTQTHENGEFFVHIRDLGSTNGIRINGQRLEEGKVRPGDELSIAHIRYRLELEPSGEVTVADTYRSVAHHDSPSPGVIPAVVGPGEDNPLAAAFRGMLPAAIADRCQIQVIVQVPPEAQPAAVPAGVSASDPAAPAVKAQPCPPASSL